MEWHRVVLTAVDKWEVSANRIRVVGGRKALMPMPAEYHENHGNHENANFALGATQDASNMTANMYRVGGKVTAHTFRRLMATRRVSSAALINPEKLMFANGDRDGVPSPPLPPSLYLPFYPRSAPRLFPLFI